MLSETAPTSVLINRKGEILHCCGETQDYLEQPTETCNPQLIHVVAEQLQDELRAAISQAICNNANQEVIITHDVPRKGAFEVLIKVQPLMHPAALRDLFLVSFDASHGAMNMYADNDNNAVHSESGDQDKLQNIISSLESANDAVSCMNGDLQSTREELETSNKVMHSLNEEFGNVNAELHAKIEELTRLSNDQANLFSGARVATLFLDRQHCVKHFTPAVQDLMSIQHSDIGRSLADITLQFDDSGLLDDIAAVSTDLTRREHDVQTKDGRWFLRRVLPYRTLDDVIDGVVVNFTDITDLKGALASAQNSTDKLQLLANIMPALVTFFDTELRFVYANAAHQDWFEKSPQELIGQSLQSAMGTRRMEKVRGYFEDAAAGQRRTFQMRLKHPRLGKRSLQVTLVPYPEDANPLQGIYVLAIDLTNFEHQAEAADANRMASMSELAATIAHQLNQPLGALSNYTEVLERIHNGGDVGKQREVAKKISTQAMAASDILNELREFIGRRTLDHGPVNMNRMIERVLVLTEGRKAATGAEVDLSLASDLPEIQGGPVQIQQLLVNLVVNALEAMDNAATRRLSISTEVQRDHLVVCVSDTGPGVPKDKQHRIYEAFYTDKADGMGMGLAICRSVAEDHGGTLWLESAECGGAAFYLRLPIIDPTQKHENDVAAA